MNNKSLTSQEANIKRQEREARKWAARKARWSAWNKKAK
jgi:hypothetical protein